MKANNYWHNLNKYILKSIRYIAVGNIKCEAVITEANDNHFKLY